MPRLHCTAITSQCQVGPKIRDEILEDATALGGMGFSPILGSATVAGFSVNRVQGRFFAVRAGAFEGLRRGSAVWVHCSASRKRKSARDHDVSGMAPPSRMMRAQCSRIAANRSNMAVLIFKNICRPWRTILPAV